MKAIAIGVIALLLSACASAPTPTPAEPTIVPMPPTETPVPVYAPIDFGDIIFNPRDWDVTGFSELEPGVSLLQGIHVEIGVPDSPLSVGRIEVYVYDSQEAAAAQFEKWVEEDVAGLVTKARTTSKSGNPFAGGHTTIPASGDLPATVVAAYVVQVCRGVMEFSVSMSGAATDFLPSIEKSEQALAKVACP